MLYLSNFADAGTAMPKLETALKLAEIFKCSIDFLVGRSNIARYSPKPMPPFSKHLKEILRHFESNEYQLANGAKISRSRTHGWLTGKTTPSLDNLIKIANYYETSIDFIIGFE